MANDSIGCIEFHGDHIEMGWNPSAINSEQRENIAHELEKIAANIRKDLFEVNGKLKKFPIRKAKQLN